MAITAQDVRMWENLKARGLLPVKPRVLEIGEANWFGDVPPPDGCEVDPWKAAKAFYREMLDCKELVAIDMQGPTAIRHDLNDPLAALSTGFGIVINTGTAEHVFDQRQIFATIHDACTDGGIMTHNAPWQHPDHGLYNYSPCFFTDLAAANAYEILYFDLGVFLCLAFRKSSDKPFRVPMQRSLGISLPTFPAGSMTT